MADDANPGRSNKNDAKERSPRAARRPIPPHDQAATDATDELLLAMGFDPDAAREEAIKSLQRGPALPDEMLYTIAECRGYLKISESNWYRRSPEDLPESFELWPGDRRSLRVRRSVLLAFIEKRAKEDRERREARKAKAKPALNGHDPQTAAAPARKRGRPRKNPSRPQTHEGNP